MDIAPSFETTALQTCLKLRYLALATFWVRTVRRTALTRSMYWLSATAILSSTNCVLPCIPCCVQGLLVLWSAAFIGVGFAGNFLEGSAHLHIRRLP